MSGGRTLLGLLRLFAKNFHFYYAGNVFMKTGYTLLLCGMIEQYCKYMFLNIKKQTFYINFLFIFVLRLLYAIICISHRLPVGWWSLTGLFLFKAHTNKKAPNS